jgi:predicted outer membrane repeat protein
MKLYRSIIAVMSFVTLLATNAYATVRHVCAGTCCTSGTCWANHYATIQAAIDAAVSGEDMILVAEGNYAPPSLPSPVMNINKSLPIFGSCDGASTHDDPIQYCGKLDLYPSTADGHIPYQGYSYHVIKVSADEVLISGFNVKNGKAALSGDSLNGGGLFAKGSEQTPISYLTIDNCRFTSNHAAEDGGAIFLVNVANVAVEDSTFSGNSCDSEGGAFYANSATSLTVSACAFTDNYSGLNAGGLNLDDATAEVDDCSFDGNIAAEGGGGILLTDAAVTVSRCSFNRNFAFWWGGGIHNNYSDTQMVNCLFTFNIATDGGAISNHHSNASIVNSSFSMNGGVYGGAVYSIYSSPTIVNSILWHDFVLLEGYSDDPEIGNTEATTTVSYSDVEGGATDSGNVATDPRFINGADLMEITADDGGADYIVVDDGTEYEEGDIVIHQFDGVRRKVTLIDGNTVYFFPELDSGSLASELVVNWGQNADSLNLDLHLHFGSTAVDGATSTDAPSEDLGGRSRYAGDGYDMGCYEQKLLFVDDSSSCTSGCGGSWGNAYSIIQDAVDAAADHDLILVAGGTYTPPSSGDNIPVVEMKEQIYLLGGFTTGATRYIDRGDPADNSSLLDGQGHHHVVIGASSTLLDGFSIENGYEEGSTACDSFFCRGGGFYVKDASDVVISHCYFSGNLVEDSVPAGGGYYYGEGAAIFGGTVSELVIADCMFKNNHANGSTGNGASGGGAIYTNYGDLAVVTSDFVDNGAARLNGRGGAIHTSRTNPVIIDGCLFHGNTAGFSGGAVHMDNLVEARIFDSTFESNSACADGGALSLLGATGYQYLDIFRSDFHENTVINNGGAIKGSWPAGSDARVIDSVFDGNAAETSGDSGSHYGGGAIACLGHWLIRNCLFTDNRATSGWYYHGGAIASGNYLTVENSTFSGNYADTRGGGAGGGAIYSTGSLTVVDSIFWNDSAGINPEITLPATYDITYSIVEGGVDGNDASNYILDTDPLWVVDGVTIFCELQHGVLEGDTSPAVDYGSQLSEDAGMSFYSTRSDHEPDSSTVDLGCHEPAEIP